MFVNVGQMEGSNIECFILVYWDRICVAKETG
jgi:hypothetical protein